MSTRDPGNFEDDGGTPAWKARRAAEAEADKQTIRAKRRRIASHIAGVWVWGCFGLIGVSVLGVPDTFWVGYFLLLLATIPIFLAAAVYASAPQDMPSGWDGYHRNAMRHWAGRLTPRG